MLCSVLVFEEIGSKGMRRGWMAVRSSPTVEEKEEHVATGEACLWSEDGLVHFFARLEQSHSVEHDKDQPPATAKTSGEDEGTEDPKPEIFCMRIRHPEIDFEMLKSTDVGSGVVAENIQQARLHRMKGRRQGIRAETKGSSQEGETVGKECTGVDNVDELVGERRIPKQVIGKSQGHRSIGEEIKKVKEGEEHVRPIAKMLYKI